MKKVYVVVIICLSVIINSCKAKKKYKTEELFTVIVVLDSFGRCNLSQSFFEKSSLANEDLTSSLYGYLNNTEEIIAFPVNDVFFNYRYFETKIRPNIKGKKVQLFVKKYNFDNKEIFIVHKII